MLLGKEWFRHEEECSQTTDGGEKQAVITFPPYFFVAKNHIIYLIMIFPFPNSLFMFSSSSGLPKFYQPLYSPNILLSLSLSNKQTSKEITKNKIKETHTHTQTLAKTQK